MKARDVFGVVVRGSGLFVLLFSLWYLAYGVAFLANMLTDTSRESYMLGYFLTGCPGLLVGFFLMRFARPIVRFCYPEGKEDSEE